MENNQELEQAEIELEIALHKKRNRKKLIRQNKLLSDYLIEFTALAHLLAAVTSPFIFTITLISISDGAKIPKVVLWLILPAGLVSLGTSLGLYRVLELSKQQMKQNDSSD